MLSYNLCVLFQRRLGWLDRMTAATLLFRLFRIGGITSQTAGWTTIRLMLDTIPGYYPAIISKETFATVQQVRHVRPSFTGKSGFNVFCKLAFAPSGATMVCVNKGREKGWHYLVSTDALRGKARRRRGRMKPTRRELAAVACKLPRISHQARHSEADENRTSSE